jgi:uncharacterized UPF0160 family protein
MLWNFMEEKITSRSVGTHDGTFHADEVTACALLLLFNLVDRSKIIRTRDEKRLAECEYVCDVGGVYEPSIKRFDHHQADYQGSLSSAGMILKYLKDESMIDEKVYDFFNRSLIIGVDAHDNGKVHQEIGHCSFSHIVSNFTPVKHDATKEELDAAFLEGLDFVFGHLKRLYERYQYIQKCKEKVEERMGKDLQCLLFEEGMPWLESFFELGGEDHPALFVIMPSGVHWKLRAIPPNYEDRMAVRCPLPKAWAGKSDGELKQISGIEGAIFCHKGRFISVWQTKEDALNALKYTLQHRGE